MTKSKTAANEETGLAVLDRSAFLALSGDNAELDAAVDSVAELGESFGTEDLIRVPTPTGGGTVWAIPDGVGGEESASEIEGVLCYVLKRGILWPTEEPVENTKPVLVTHDLKVAEQIGEIPDSMRETLEKHRLGDRTFDWESLPFNLFGSGKNGIGKRCREQRVLFILRPGDLYPLVVPANPGSLKAMRQFILRLPQAAKVPYWRCVVRLSLEKTKSGNGQPYSRIVPRLAGVLGPEEGAMIKKRFTDNLSQIAKKIDVADGEG